MQFASVGQAATFDVLNVQQQLKDATAKIAEMESWFQTSATLTMDSNCNCKWTTLPSPDIIGKACGYKGDRCYELTCEAGYYATAMTLYEYDHKLTFQVGSVENALQCCQPCYKGTLKSFVTD